MKIFSLPVLMVVAAVAVAAIILFTLGQPEHSAQQESPKPSVSAAPTEPSATGAGFGSQDAFSSDGPSHSEPQTEEQVAADELVSVAGEELAEVPLKPWEQAINKILESDQENQQVAAQLMALLPTLPPDGQVEAVQHMVNLTDDESYQNAAAMLLNPATAADVAEVIYSDVLNRPNTVKLPVMVSILRTPGHRLRDETLSTLQIFLGEDLGDNPEAWNIAVQNYLAKEAQEAAAAELEAPTAQ